MILKEDYFDDLKLTDDDIKSSDDNYILPNHNTDNYANGKEYYKAMSSKYSHYIVLGIKKYENILTYSELWNNKIPHMLKKLFYLFDAYGIEYSTPVVSEEYHRVCDFIKTKFKGCKIFDFYGYKLITVFDTLKDLKYEKWSVLLFFNPPKTQSYTTVCKIIGNMMRTLWKNEDYDTFVESFYVFNFMPDITFGMYNPYTYNNVVNYKTSILLVNIIKLFFPEKKYNNIKKELTKDKQLLLKLYNCFPDY